MNVPTPLIDAYLDDHLDDAGVVELQAWLTADRNHLREFLRGLCNHAGANVHVRLLAGLEIHHVVEAIFKAFARALYQATRVTGEGIPSTKGAL